MNNYKKSNYAINKIRKGIIYRNADGSILEVTYEKIAAENPNFTATDFEKLKQLSDELYHEEEKSDNLQAHYVKAVSYTHLDVYKRQMKWLSNASIDELGNGLVKNYTDISKSKGFSVDIVGFVTKYLKLPII